MIMTGYKQEIKGKKALNYSLEISTLDVQMHRCDAMMVECFKMDVVNNSITRKKLSKRTYKFSIFL